jgi:hypothetical protein
MLLLVLLDRAVKVQGVKKLQEGELLCADNIDPEVPAPVHTPIHAPILTQRPPLFPKGKSKLDAKVTDCCCFMPGPKSINEHCGLRSKKKSEDECF